MLEDKVKAAITEHALINKGDTVLVGVSGGADSVALLCALLSLRGELGFDVRAAHLNHAIRGGEADADEAFVLELCDKLGVPCAARKIDVPAEAASRRHTLEQAARDIRYAFLREAAQNCGANSIAVAHHMDDQAETLLLHLARGSGLAGLTGMRPRNGDIIRPLLYCRRAEIEQYLDQSGIPYRTDSTNLKPDHARNKLRLDVIPYFEANINSGFVEALCSAAELLAIDENYLDAQAKAALSRAKTDTGYDRQALLALPPALLSRAIRIALTGAGAAQDIERLHVRQIIALLCAPTGTRLHVPHADVWVDYESICFGAYRESHGTNQSVPFTGEGEYALAGGVFCVARAAFPPEGYKADRYTAYLDADKLAAFASDDICFRTRADGDRFFPIGAPGRKKLKDYFIDRKVSRGARDIPMLCAGSEVLFLPGHSVSELVKLDGGTQNVLRMAFETNNNL